MSFNIYLLKKISGILFSVLLGLIFLYSGYTKLVPVIETFEFTFVDTGVASWYTAPVLARLFIALELCTGILLIFCFRLRQFTLPLTIGILVFFTIYLAVQIMFTGNSGNCGCFGEHIKMTPLQGIIKNLILLLGACITYYFYGGWSSRYPKLIISVISAISLALPFIINPVDYAYTSNNLDEEVGYSPGIEKLYQNHDSNKVQIPSVNLREGKHVVAFLSLTCNHCRIAAKKLRLIKKNNESLPIYFVLNGDSARYDAFIEDTRADNIPSSFCLGKTFVQLAGAKLPRIYYLSDGKVVKKVDYFELSQYDIEDWIAEDH